MKKYIWIPLLILGVVFISTTIGISKNTQKKEAPSSILAIGTGNPGKIILFAKKNGYTPEKTIDTDYKFVYTVRVGTIKNDGKPYVIAGVSNSFFAKPYGCKVIAYDLENYKQELIDDVGDLRCKDLTIGDAYNDGKNTIILTTHGIGIVRVYSWINNSWKKEDLDTNFISQIDKQENTDHRVPNSELSCQDCIVQTAVHIAKIADVDNDGKNEVIATHSSPLELQNKDEISFIKVYKYDGSKWKSEVVDRLTNREFRSVTVGDIYNKKENILLIGIGSPRNEKGSLYAYEQKEGKWQKTVVHDDKEEMNMKGVDIGDIYRDGKQRILLATGFPNANIMLLTWNGSSFDNEVIGRVASLFNDPEAQFNSMAAFMMNENGKPSLIVGGMATYPKQKIGWEGTDKGFLIQYNKEGNEWKSNVIAKPNILGLDLKQFIP